MSKTIVNALIREIVTNVSKSNDIVRDFVDKYNPLLITITPENFEQTIVSNSIIILQKNNVAAEQKKQEEAYEATHGAPSQGGLRFEAAMAVAARDKNLMKAMEQVTDYVVANFEAKYNKTKTAKMEPAKTGADGSIQLYFSKWNKGTNETYFKAPYLALVSEAIDKNSLLKGVKDNWETFKRQTQMLHTERTVGSEYLTQFDRVLSGQSLPGDKQGVKGMKPSGGDQASFDKALSDELKDSVEDSIDDFKIDFKVARNAAQSVIRNMILDTSWIWVSDQNATSENFWKTITIQGKLGPNALNRPGEESTDWKGLRPMLEKRIEDEIKKKYKKDFVTSGASPSPKKIISSMLVNRILNSFLGMAGPSVSVKTKKKTRVKKKDPKRGKIGKVGKSKKLSTTSSIIQSKTKAHTEEQRTIDKKQTKFSPISLLTLLNNKLPETLTANMKEPRLVNRTGRFRQSVKVQNMMGNSKFPTIQYTYQRDPYEVFEKDSDRDPRKLIDASIREIAAKVMKGRFYTQRV
jgi:hypothetical protein